MMEKVDKVLETLKERNLDGLFVTKRANVNYISNFTDEASYVLISNKGNFFITDGRFFELAQKLCKEYEILNWQNIGRNVVDTVKFICEKHGIKKLGFEGVCTTYDMYENLCNSMPNAEIIPTTNIFEKIRYTKSKNEIALIRQACKITDKAFEEILGFIKPGMTENEVAAKLEYIMKINGASGPSFDTILISGKKTSLPHGKPDDNVIKDGDFITLDFGALYKGYHADMTRTIVIGKADKKQVEVYNVVKSAQQSALDAVKSGITSKIPDDIVREIVKDYIEYYYPGIGHGLGLELYENPFIGKNGDMIIQKNCVMTVEPGLYIPNWGGVRIEDTILVTDNGPEKLTNSSKELICL